MKVDTAVLAIVIALAGGYYFARWRRAELDSERAKTGAEGVEKALRHARRTMLVVGIVFLMVIDLWIRGKGR